MGKRRPSRATRLLRGGRGTDPDPRKQNAIVLHRLAQEPPKRMERPPHPDAVTTKYRSRLSQIAAGSFDRVKPLIDLLHRYQAIADKVIRQDDRDDPDEPPPKSYSPDDLRLADQNRHHKHKASGATVQPLFAPHELIEEVEATRKRLTIYRDNLPVDGIAGEAADMLEKWRIGVDLRVMQSLGLQPVKPGTELAAARDMWVNTNAALITSQPREVADRVAQHIAEMVPQGHRWETIAHKLEHEEGIAHRRAALIARDQVAKYNADLTRIQQQAAGIEFYQWRGAMDNRERPTHVALEGTIWKWGSGPPIGDPGTPIQCRCVAIPVTSDQLKRQAGTVSEADLISRTAALGPTQREGPDTSEADVLARAKASVASEIKLANRREAGRKV